MAYPKPSLKCELLKVNALEPKVPERNIGRMRISCSVFAGVVSGTALTLVLSGCGKSGSQSEPAMPETQSALNTAATETKKAISEGASKIAETAKATASDATSKFLSTLKNQGDNVLSSIGQDLAAKAKSLVDSCGANEAVKSNVENSLNSLAAGKDSEALAPAFQLSANQAQTQTQSTGSGLGLTAPQMQLAKEVGNLASAFVVQRNFSSLPGAQGDVATLVNSLRNGQYAATLPPLKNIMGNASLTPAQKDLLGTVADKYAPSLKQAAGTLQQGLQTLQGLGGKK